MPIAIKLKQAMSEGEYLVAYELSLKELESKPNDQQLKYSAVMALARMGASYQAQQLYQQYQLASVNDVDIAALEARIEKDLASLAKKSKRRAHYLAAAQKYRDVFEDHNESEYYPAINAASMYFLAGEKVLAQEYAKKVIALCDVGQANYWSLVSIAEAQLLLGDAESSIANIEKALSIGNVDITSRGSTLKQFKLLNAPDQVLKALKMPTVIHYAGHIISAPRKSGKFPAELEEQVRLRIRQQLEKSDAMISYGSLAAGADILFAEEVLARGGEINIILPFDKQEFIEVSVATAKADWVERFEACFAKAKSCTYSSTGNYDGNDTLFYNCSNYAMGLTCLRADHLSAPVQQLVVWNHVAEGKPAGTASDRQLWMSYGYPSTIIPVNTESTVDETLPNENLNKKNQLRAVVFGDIAGFSKLSDQQIPLFVDKVMGELSIALNQKLENVGKASLLSANTWGDGIFLVFDNVINAAKSAWAMQKCMRELDLTDYGFPETPQLRLGAHFGPIFEFKDPITMRLNYFGNHVNTAARIEPIAPKGEVFVTEAFAAQLALEPDKKFGADYVGEMELAKKFGRARMYMLKRSR